MTNPNRIHVCMIVDTTAGGASIGAQRLAAALRQTDGILLTAIAATGNPAPWATRADRRISLKRLLISRLVAKYRGAISAGDVFYNDVTVSDMVKTLVPDIMLLQCIHQSLSFGLLERLPAHLPILWTLRDMWPLTGHCAYSCQCRKYLQGCTGNCPEWGHWGQAVATPDREWRRRDKFFAQNAGRIRLVAPSRWLTNIAHERFEGRIRAECIPNSVDTEVFKPLPERRFLRSLLGLPASGTLVMAGAVKINDPRKGTRYLLEALNILRAAGEDITCMTFGETDPDQPFPENVLSLGSVKDMPLLNLYYNAADLFVLPSQADNLPNTLLEATAAGTPSVVFDIGGCPEVVRDGENGFVAGRVSAEALADAIRRYLRAEAAERQALRQRCREIALADYCMVKQGQAYACLIREKVGR